MLKNLSGKQNVELSIEQ